MAIGCCILLFFAGLIQSLNLPNLTVGFIMGIWVINTTVSRRGLLETLTRVDMVIKPFFYFFIGTLIGGYGGGIFFHWPPLLPLILMVLVVRAMGRTLGYAVSQYVWNIPATWHETLELSARPLGSLSVAVAIQAFYMLPLTHNTLIAGLLATVFVSQLLLFPPVGNLTRPNLAPSQKD